MGFLRKGTKCLICRAQKIDREAILFLPAYRLALCKEHFISWVKKRVYETIKQFSMFSKEDKILTAVSGGKDSLSLWFILNDLGYIADGLYIDLGIDKYSEDSKDLAKNFSERIGRKLYIIEVKNEIGRIPEVSKITNRPICSICGTVKRYLMNKYAKQLGYNIIATGHNLDDEVSFLFNNTLNWDIIYLSRQYPVLTEGKGFVKKVKPLCKITEKESAMFAFFNKIDYIKYECPFSLDSVSIKYKKFFSMLEEEFPSSKIRFYNNFLKNIFEILSKYREEEKLRNCIECGEPSLNEICSFCVLKNKFRKLENELELTKKV